LACGRINSNTLLQNTKQIAALRLSRSEGNLHAEVCAHVYNIHVWQKKIKEEKGAKTKDAAGCSRTTEEILLNIYRGKRDENGSDCSIARNKTPYSGPPTPLRWALAVYKNFRCGPRVNFDNKKPFPWRTVLKKSIVKQLVKKFSALMDSDGLPMCSQELVIRPYPRPVKSYQHLHFYKIHFNIILPSTPIFLINVGMCIFRLPHVCYMSRSSPPLFNKATIIGWIAKIMKPHVMYEIWGSHGGDDVDVCPLGCNVVWTCR
jgi:hypothetical protein